MPGAHVPIEIKLHQKSRVMEISFSDGRSFRLPYEFLRVYSPSAEVRGHGPGQEVLQTGKREVEIRVLEPVGSYAVQPVFSDGTQHRHLFVGLSVRAGPESGRALVAVPLQTEGRGRQPRPGAMTYFV